MPRTGARKTVLATIRELPNYLKLLVGLLADRRVSGLDKALVGAAIAYVLLPMDFLPDFIPFLGQVDDIYLLVLAVQRLVANAGPGVVATHWPGDPKDLSATSLRAAVGAAAFFLPRRMTRRLRRLVGR
jgi:uncharacterized membrane protein YkvA (DUF1232 family)